MPEKKTSSLPSIKQLLQETWILFKKTWFSYLKLIGLIVAYVFLAVLIGILISLPVTFVAVGTHFEVFHHLTPFHISILVLLGLWVILFLASLVAINVIVPIVSIFILQGKKADSLISLIKQSKNYFWPFLLTGLLAVLLYLGGLTLLVIPGLLIAFFFLFVVYEVVLEKQSGIVALQRSYYLIKSHFWEVLVRFLLVEIIAGVISSILNKYAGGDFLLTLVYIAYSILAGWFVNAYLFLVYKQIRAATTIPQEISIRWIWIVSGIGWVICILLLGVLFSGIAHLPGMRPTPAHSLPHPTANAA